MLDLTTGSFGYGGYAGVSIYGSCTGDARNLTEFNCAAPVPAGARPIPLGPNSQIHQMIQDGKPATISLLRPLLCQGSPYDGYYDIDATPGQSLLDECFMRFSQEAIVLTEHTHCMLTNDGLESVPDGYLDQFDGVFVTGKHEVRFL